jgi:hypothetical protein
MNYMYSLNATANGQMRMIVDFDVATNPNTDLILAQSRETQAASQLPRRSKQLRRHRAEIRDCTLEYWYRWIHLKERVMRGSSPTTRTSICTISFCA